MSARFYLIQSPPISFESEEKLAEAIGAIDLAKAIVVKGVALQPRMQLALLPIGPAEAPAPRPQRAVPEPEAGVKAAVLEFWSIGTIASKRKFCAETGMAVDTASNAIDWLVQQGTLVKCDDAGQTAVKGKSYTRKEQST